MHFYSIPRKPSKKYKFSFWSMFFCQIETIGFVKIFGFRGKYLKMISRIDSKNFVVTEMSSNIF